MAQKCHFGLHQVMPAEQQCAELAAIRQELSWVREGKKTALFEPYLYKMIILPRQARDRHRENSKKAHFLLLEGDDITDCTRETGPASCVHCNTSTVAQ